MLARTPKRAAPLAPADLGAGPALGRRELLLGCAIFALVGALGLAYLNAFEFTSPTKYHGDLTQSPHWIAYHGDAFAEDDLLVAYGSYNETAVQNAIYWIGTLFLDVVLLSKLVGIAIYGLTAALFFLLVARMSGPWAGALAASFFVIFPRSSYEIAGGFSKAWAIGFVLLAVYVVETRAWRLLPWIMPVAALAYPVAPVLIGAIAFVGLALELPRTVREAWREGRFLALGSALALVPLLYKYLTPPPFVGAMISTRRMRELWELGISSEATLPLWKEVLSYLQQPFFLYSTVLLLMLLARRGLVWKRSWSALVGASAIAYFVADLVVPQLYLPDRYTRYSIAVLLVLWHAHNWSRVLEAVGHPWVRRAALAAVVVFAAASFPDTFKPCDGDKELGRWEDRDSVADLARAVATLPQPVLVAGVPFDLSDVMVQARRPVLVIHRMVHHWFEGYRQALDARIQDTLRALYAADVGEVNQLRETHGVTHLVVPKTAFEPSMLGTGEVYRVEFDEFVAALTRDRTKFLLDPPPRSSVVYEDRQFWLVRLPLDEPARQGM